VIGMTGSSSGRVAAGLSPPTYVVLGMVRLGARSGYEIKQMVELSIRFFWTISHVQIYPALRQLESEGLIVGRDDPRGRLPRRVYEITERGEQVLEEWVAEAEPMPFELRDLGMVKLFFADAVSDEQALGLLAAVRNRSEERLSLLLEIVPTAESAGDDGSHFPNLTLQMGIAFHQAMVDVCADFEQTLHERVRGA
jgi:PadR family transcriptional regulator, regulatory protein AphA